MRAGEKYEICVQGLKDFVEQAGFTDVVVGLSGGIDSALTAVMGVDAFGADKVHGVLLPGPYSSNHSVDDAQALAHNLGISTCVASIVEPFEAFERVMKQATGQPLEGLAAENTQARCRMICLMAFSNVNRWLLMNTGNKSESLVGYSTLYGDTAGAYAPLGELYKTEVYELSFWRNAREEAAGREGVIPLNTLEKAPSAELAPGQADEKSLGIDYADLDRILMSLVEEGKSIEETSALGYAKEEVERIAALMAASAFKRAYEPPCPQGITH